MSFLADESNFDALVLASIEPVIVDFFATWCPPCIKVGPMVDKLEREFLDRLQVARVDIDQSPALAEAYEVDTIPHFTYIVNGQVVSQLTDDASYRAVRAYFEACANQPDQSSPAITVDPVAEAAYEAAVEQAVTDLNAAMEDPVARYTTAAAPLERSYRRKVQYRGRKLRSGNLGQEEHDAQIAALKSEFEQAMLPIENAYDTAMAEHTDVYHAAMKSANAAFHERSTRA